MMRKDAPEYPVLSIGKLSRIRNIFSQKEISTHTKEK
jgi:hypothetical protein